MQPSNTPAPNEQPQTYGSEVCKQIEAYLTNWRILLALVLAVSAAVVYVTLVMGMNPNVAYWLVPLSAVLSVFLVAAQNVLRRRTGRA